LGKSNFEFPIDFFAPTPGKEAFFFFAFAFEEPRAAAGVELHEPIITVDVPVEYVPPIEIDKPLSHKSENFDTLFENRVIGLRNVNEQATEQQKGR
jgi:hypothetical protein